MGLTSTVERIQAVLNTRPICYSGETNKTVLSSWGSKKEACGLTVSIAKNIIALEAK